MPLPTNRALTGSPRGSSRRSFIQWTPGFSRGPGRDLRPVTSASIIGGSGTNNVVAHRSSSSSTLTGSALPARPASLASRLFPVWPLPFAAAPGNIPAHMSQPFSRHVEAAAVGNGGNRDGGGGGVSAYYAVAVGRKVGVFQTWSDAQRSVQGVSGAVYRKFPSEAAALAFIASSAASRGGGGGRASDDAARTASAAPVGEQVGYGVGADDGGDGGGGVLSWSAPSPAGGGLPGVATSGWVPPAVGPFYAVARGRKVGILRTWGETQAAVDGVPGAVHKRFSILSEAHAFLRLHTAPPDATVTAAPNSSKAEGSTGEALPAPDAAAFNTDASTEYPNPLAARAYQQLQELQQSQQQQPQQQSSVGLPAPESKSYYAVARGWKTGIFTSWAEASTAVDGYCQPVFRKFKRLGSAKAFIAADKALSQQEQQRAAASAAAKRSSSASPSKGKASSPKASKSAKTAEAAAGAKAAAAAATTAEAGDAGAAEPASQDTVGGGSQADVQSRKSRLRPQPPPSPPQPSQSEQDDGAAPPRRQPQQPQQQQQRHGKLRRLRLPDLQSLPRRLRRQPGDYEWELLSFGSLGEDIKPRLKYRLEFDGGSRGNPGRAGFGAVLLEAASGRHVEYVAGPLTDTTNNVAEWSALAAGMQLALDLGVRRLVVRGDSELVCRQVSGVYGVNNASLRPLAARVAQLRSRLGSFTVEHVGRSSNAVADLLSNLAMDAETTVAGLAEDDEETEADVEDEEADDAQAEEERRRSFRAELAKHLGESAVRAARDVAAAAATAVLAESVLTTTAVGSDHAASAASQGKPGPATKRSGTRGRPGRQEPATGIRAQISVTECRPPLAARGSVAGGPEEFNRVLVATAFATRGLLDE